MAIKRLHYFDHQFLVEADFTDEQRYHLEMRRRLNRALHTIGIGEGLEVVKTTNKIVTVRPGVAIDRLGREMIIETAQDVDLSAITTAVPAFITIAYDEQETDPSTATGAPGNTRFTEQPILQAVTASPPTDGTVIVLARIDLTAGGNVPGNPNDAFDGGVRRAAGPRGERGPASIDGVSNPGGDVDLVAGAGIAITPDQANRRITIATSGTQGLVSLDSVSNPGGNIDLVPAQAIVITPNDAANTITIGENHSTQTGNVHNLSAANLQTIGALLANDYDLRRREVASVAFTQADANGATRTVTVGFQPQLVVVVGTVTSNLSARFYSGGVGAFAFLDAGPPATVVQRCFGFGVTRFSNTDWFSRSLISLSIGHAILVDTQPAPPQNESLFVVITNFTVDGLVARLDRPGPPGGTVALTNFSIALHMVCLG